MLTCSRADDHGAELRKVGDLEAQVVQVPGNPSRHTALCPRASRQV